MRTGGFIASARNPVELTWVRSHAAVGAISLALDLGRDMAAAGAGGSALSSSVFDDVVAAVTGRLGGRALDRGPLRLARPTVTTGGWDHGTFGIGDHEVPYLNEFMAVTCGDDRIASYPDTIVVLRADTGEALAVKDAVAGLDVVLLAVPADELPVSSSAVDPSGLAEVERIMDLPLTPYLTPGLTGGTHAYGR